MSTREPRRGSGRTENRTHGGKSTRRAVQDRRAGRAAAPARTIVSKKQDPGAPCPIMHECGGCALLGRPYHKQLAQKQAAMEALFRPIFRARGYDLKLSPIQGMGGTLGEGKLPSPRAFRYKAATPFAPTADGGVAGGFFAAGTHTIVPVPSCCVEAPHARQILNIVAQKAAELGIPAYDEDAHAGILRYAVLRLSWKRPEGILTLVTAKKDAPAVEELARAVARMCPQITCVAQNVNPRRTNAILGGETRTLLGDGFMQDELLGCTFRISPTAFYQTNPAQTELLYQIAIDGMGLADGDVLMDAYCGSGTIGLCAVAQAARAGVAARLVGVERNTAGIADARANAQLNNLGDVSEFFAQDATAFMREAARRGERVDVLSMDPPRAGATPEFLDAAAALAPRRITYISCNPTTQARDLEHLMDAGYRPLTLTPVDMFPHTSHVETVAVLER